MSMGRVGRSPAARKNDRHQAGRAGRSRRRFLLSALTLLAVLALLFTVRRDPEPTAMLLTGEQYLNFAREKRVDLDAPETLEAAAAKLEEARFAMRRQFGRPALLRDYEETRQLLGEAHRLISRSVEEARSSVQDRESRLREEIAQVRTEIEEVRALLLYLPPDSRKALRHIVAAESRIWAAEAKLSSQESLDALESMRQARAEVSLALQGVRDLLSGFLGRREEWKNDLEETLAWAARPGRVALVIDKLNHKAYLVRNGRRVRTFAAELGPGWLDRKVREGDGATPEGRYRIVRKKSDGATRYHKALLLDYPNQGDSARFERMVKGEELPRWSGIGGLIEVHGEGGKGEDWTMGCISLRNEDIDEIFPQIGLGDPVTIVGLWDEPDWLTRALETASR